VQAQPWELSDGVRQRPDGGRIVHRHAAAAETGVQVEVHLELHPRGCRGPGQHLRRHPVLDVDADPRPTGERRQPAGGVRSGDGVGDDDVVEPGVDEHLGLRDLGHREAARPCPKLHPGQLDRLVGLHVGAESRTVRGRFPLPAFDVALERIEVDQERRRWQVIDGHAAA
jgi:hypothetical protein